jgi:hypothetical protein
MSKCRASIVLIAALLIGGCAGREYEQVDLSELPVGTASRRELIEHINGPDTQINGIKGDLDLGFRKLPGEPVKQCSGKLLSARLSDSSSSAGLYLKGYKKLIPTFFTMVSDGREFWLHIPRDKTVYTGPVESRDDEHEGREVALQAIDLIRAIYVQRIDTTLGCNLIEEKERYILILRDGEIPVRRIWIERRRFTIERETYYNAEGAEEVGIARGGYALFGESLFPTKIEITDAASGGTVYLDFKKIEFDPANVPQGAFRFSMPGGIDIERID